MHRHGVSAAALLVGGVVALASCGGVEPALEGVEPREAALRIGPGQLGHSACWFSYKGELCFHGSSLTSGCKSACGVAAVPVRLQLLDPTTYVVSGRAVDGMTGLPAPNVTVHVVMPDLRSHAVNTAIDGSFTLRIASSDPTAAESRTIEMRLGTMSLAPGARTLTIVGNLEDAFYAAHPEVSRETFDVSGLPPIVAGSDRGGQVLRIEPRLLQRPTGVGTSSCRPVTQ